MTRIPTLLLTPEESRDRNGILTPTISGPVQIVDGKYGKAWKVEESTINYYNDPSFEQDAKNGDYIQAFTREYVSDNPKFGTRCAKYTPTEGSNTPYTFYRSIAGSIQTGKTYTASIYTRSDRPIDGYFQLEVRSPSGTPWRMGTIHVSTSTEWQRHVFTIPAQTASLTDAYAAFWFSIPRESTDLTNSLYIDGIQLEEKEYATSFCSGDLGDGYFWQGTPYESPSVRESSYVRFDLSQSPFREKEGTVLVRCRFQRAKTGGYQYAVRLSGPLGIFGLGRYPSEHETGSRRHIFSAGNGAGRSPEIPDDTFVNMGIRIRPYEAIPDYSGWEYVQHRFGESAVRSTFPAGANLSGYNAAELSKLTEHQNMEIEGILYFEDYLDDEEYFYYDEYAGRWNWSDFMPRIGGLIRDNIDANPIGAVSREARAWAEPTGTSVSTPMKYFLPLDHSTQAYTKTGQDSPTVMGAPRWVDDDALLVEEASTNLISNPSFELSLSGTGTDNRSILERSSEAAIFGDWGLKVSPNSGTGNYYFYFIRSSSSGELTPNSHDSSYVFSIWVRGAGNYQLRPRITLEDGTSAYGNADFTVPDDEPFRLVSAPMDPGGKKVMGYVLTVYSVEQRVFHADGAQLEKGNYATSYIDGSLGEGYSWSGTAHNSQSSRELTSVYLEALDAQRGAIAMKFKGGVGHPSNGYLWSAGTTGTTFLSMGYYPVVRKLRPVIYVDGKSYGSTLGYSEEVGDGYETVVLEWDGPYFGFYTSMGDAKTMHLPQTRRQSGTRLRLGTYGTGFFSNSSFKGVAIFDQPLTETERQHLFDNDKWTREELQVRIAAAARTSFREESEIDATVTSFADLSETSASISTMPELVLPLDGSFEGRTKEGPFLAQPTGAIRWFDTPSGKGFRSEEGTTNLMMNPRIHPSGTGSNFHMNGASGGFADNVPELNDTAYKIETNTTSSSLQGFIQSSQTGLGYTDSRQFTFSAFIMGEGPLRLRTLAYYTDGGYSESSTHIDVSSTPQRYVCAPVTTLEGRTLNYIQGRVDFGKSENIRETDYWVSKTQIEEKPYATSYTDGSLGNGYSWAGSPNTSVSHRVDQSHVSLWTGQPMNVETGSVMVRYKLDTVNAPFAQYVWNLGGLSGGTDFSYFAFYVSSSSSTLWLRDNTTSVRLSGGPIENNVWYTSYLGWDLTNLYVDFGKGEGIRTIPRTRYNGQWFTTSSSVHHRLGAPGINGRFQANGLISNFAMFEKPLSQPEVDKLRQASEWDWESLIPMAGAVMRAPTQPPIIASKASPLII